MGASCEGLERGAQWLSIATFSELCAGASDSMVAGTLAGVCEGASVAAGAGVVALVDSIGVAGAAGLAAGMGAGVVAVVEMF